MLDSVVPADNPELSVLLVDEKRMKELNLEYLSRDEVTDVLAFPQLTGEEFDSIEVNAPEPLVLGDIVICLPVAASQAAERGIEEDDEVRHLAAHGLLHLTGYEDETVEGAEKMVEMENSLLGRNTVSRGLEE